MRPVENQPQILACGMLRQKISMTTANQGKAVRAG
jgi:hypothetical protein